MYLGGPDGRQTRYYQPDQDLIIFEPGTTPQDAVLLLEFYKEGKDIDAMTYGEMD